MSIIKTNKARKTLYIKAAMVFLIALVLIIAPATALAEDGGDSVESSSSGSDSSSTDTGDSDTSESSTNQSETTDSSNPEGSSTSDNGSDGSTDVSTADNSGSADASPEGDSESSTDGTDNDGDCGGASESDSDADNNADDPDAAENSEPGTDTDTDGSETTSPEESSSDTTDGESDKNAATDEPDAAGSDFENAGTARDNTGEDEIGTSNSDGNDTAGEQNPVTDDTNGAEPADAAGMDNEEAQSTVYFQVEEESMNPLLSSGTIIEVVSDNYADGDLVAAQKSDGTYIVKMLEGEQLVSLGAGTNYAANDLTILGAVAPSTITQAELELNGISFNSVLAETSVEPASGDGSEGSPYEIEKWENLYWLSQESDEWDENYIQTSDIVFPDEITEWDSDKGWTPIGNSTNKFTGSYDAQSNTISNLFINRPGEDYVGLFGYTEGATLTNIDLEDVDITGDDTVGGLVGENNGGTITNSYSEGTVKGNKYVGGLIGENDEGTITNSYATCDVTGDDDNVGGLVGENDEGTITNSYATGDVTGDDDKIGGLVGNNNDGTITNSHAEGTVEGDKYVGGLVGYNSGGDIINSHATGNVIGTGLRVGGLVGKNNGEINDSYATGAVKGDYNKVGGLVGENNGEINDSYATGAVKGDDDDVGGLVGDNGSSGTITNSYATGAVTGTGYSIGGLIGENGGGTITNSYATGTVTGTGDRVGGLVGENDSGTVTDSFWDTETSGQETSAGGEGKTTAEMQTLSTFPDKVWSITGGDGFYPLLWWQVGNDDDHTWHMVALPGTSDPTPEGNWFSYDLDNSFSLLTPLRRSDTVLTAISDPGANPIITPAFVTGVSAVELGRAIAVYNQAKQSYEANKDIMSAADRAVAETELAVANAAIIALELTLAAPGGAAVNSAELIAAYNAALEALNSNRGLLTAEQIAEAEALLNAIATVVSRFSS